MHLSHFYILFALFWLVGFSNAVNLTDGIDGLASISVAISLSAYSFIAYMQGKWDILFVTLSMIGALLGFFVFNHKPAKIFMGDVGSLALGGMLAALSMALHVEWTLLLIGLVYVIETGSVMLQVTYFKWSKKRYGEGRRIFRMTPFPPSFRIGWPFWQWPKLVRMESGCLYVEHCLGDKCRDSSSSLPIKRRWACPSFFTDSENSLVRKNDS